MKKMEKKGAKSETITTAHKPGLGLLHRAAALLVLGAASFFAAPGKVLNVVKISPEKISSCFFLSLFHSGMHATMDYYSHVARNCNEGLTWHCRSSGFISHIQMVKSL